MFAVSEVRELNETLDLCLRIGELLMASGAGAADVATTMYAVGEHLGMRRPDVDVTFTALSMSYRRDPHEPALIQMRQVTHRTIDYGHLTRVDHLVADIVAHRVDLAGARNRLARIVSSGHASPRWLVTVAWGVMCAGAALFLGGGPVVTAIAVAAAVAIDRVQLVMTHRRWPFFYVQVAGGLVATAFAVAAAATRVGVDPSLVVSANIVMLLAGIGFLGAIQDALSGFYLTASGRILEAMLATSGIIAGVSAGLTAASAMGLGLGRLEPGWTGWEALPVSMFGAALCAAAFAFASYVPGRALLSIALIAALAFLAYRLVEQNGFGRAWGAAVGAVVVGLVSYSVAVRVRVPPLVVVVTAVVPMLPGLAIYRGLSLLAQGGPVASSAGLLALVTAAAVAIALSAGVIFGEYVAQPLKREARRLERRLTGPLLVGARRGPVHGRRRRTRRRDRW
jgi:uncharacterized membrane protein YjjP (DUF1212 family)